MHKIVTKLIIKKVLTVINLNYLAYLDLVRTVKNKKKFVKNTGHTGTN